MRSEKVAYMQVELESVGIKTAYISRKLEDIDRRLDNATDDLRRQLDILLIAFQEAQDLVREKLILKSLQFPHMDARFRSIHTAEPGTYDWIFDDPDHLRAKETRLDISFTDWLKAGSGIFHIVGKPGSGKSTLMKFLCEQDETKEHLEEWASADDKELIFCKFFFWRITTAAEQKTLRGLVRSVLCSVISEIPSLSRRLFPKQWDARKGDSHGSLRVDLGDREISDAFEALVGDTAIFDEFRLCFFIDGLDEFEQNVSLQSDTHASLAAKLQKWTTRSGSHVKMCVSSRPLTEFTGTFPISQQITLQRLTENDILTLVTNKLENNERFEELRARSEAERKRCDALAERILGDAKGVFLWVVLVLNELEQAIANGDSLEMLEKIVATAHQELTVFIKTILESIPNRYWMGSYYLLAVVMRISGVLTSEAKAAVALDAIIGAAVQYYSDQEYHITLEECALVFDTADKGDLVNCDERLALISRDLHSDEKAMVEEKERLMIRCRGLAEVDEDLQIRFTHRSIPEALQELFSKNELGDLVRDESVTDILTWILLAGVRQLRGYEPGGLDSLPSMKRLEYVTSTHHIYSLSLHTSEATNRLLYSIQEAILFAQYDTSKPTDDKWDGWGWASPSVAPFGRHLRLGVFDYFQLREFTGWVIENKLSLSKDRKRLLAILCEVVVSSGGDLPEFYPMSFEFAVSKLLERGLTLDTNHPPGFVHSVCRRTECQIWHEFLFKELHYGMTHLGFAAVITYPHEDKNGKINWGGLETLLRFGADPDVHLSADERTGSRRLLGPTGETLYELSPDDPAADKYYIEENLIPLPLPGTVSLTDYVEFFKPPNMDRLLNLIQQNMKKKMGRPTLVVPLLKDRTHRDVLQNSEIEGSDQAEEAAQESRQGLVPRQTW
jgi:hypothetical protein